MKTFIILDNVNRRVLPQEFQSDDNRNPEILIEYFLEQYTKKGDKIIDIYAGLGTTLFVAEDLGRIPYGIEYDSDRFAYIKSEIQYKENIIHGDARNILYQRWILLLAPPHTCMSLIWNITLSQPI
ncbi:MAG: DNA methyltransferase [Candidatus Hodarchaeota archaeon]